MSEMASCHISLAVLGCPWLSLAAHGSCDERCGLVTVSDSRPQRTWWDTGKYSPTTSLSPFRAESHDELGLFSRRHKPCLDASEHIFILPSSSSPKPKPKLKPKPVEADDDLHAQFQIHSLATMIQSLSGVTRGGGGGVISDGVGHELARQRGTPVE
ncbi:hypothetical protein E4U21_002402 [Claviceps maximensis]|nr:hypothetical protein E4U21_002402 [Claviceps maximensis]